MQLSNETLQFLLDNLPTEQAFIATPTDTGGTATPVAPIDIRATAKEHNLPLFETQTFVAMSQYDLRTDVTTYRVQRK